MSTSLPQPRTSPAFLPTLTTHAHLRIHAAQVVDGAGVDYSPGALLIETSTGTVRAAGRPGDPDLDAPAELDLGDCVVMPGLVNAHAHLDLSLMGATPPAQPFVDALAAFRQARIADPTQIVRAVTLGARKSLEAGVVAVGDIAGAIGTSLGLSAGVALAATPIWGMTLYEFFGIDIDEPQTRDRLAPALGLLGADDSGGAGLSPHAPYSVGPDAIGAARRFASDAGVPLVIHLAESPEEAELVASGRGPMRELLDSLGLWNDRVASKFGRGLSPIRHLQPHLGPGVTCIHVNQASDDDLDLLAASGAHVVYCPRASAHYGGERAFGPHRYREMMERGIPVALGTDSAANLPEGAMSPEGEGISILEEMRLLHRRDGADPRVLMRMATVDAARVIGLDQSRVRLGAGCRPLGLVAIEAPPGPGTPLERALRSGGRPFVLLGEKISRGTRIV
ncbi:MAG: amidohydrolase family protein [Phycisphaerales bacterium]|nr:amidohydrolase family protein [Phycisphaerales bacterium]